MKTHSASSIRSVPSLQGQLTRSGDPGSTMQLGMADEKG